MIFLTSSVHVTLVLCHDFAADRQAYSGTFCKCAAIQTAEKTEYFFSVFLIEPDTVIAEKYFYILLFWIEAGIPFYLITEKQTA